MIDAPAPLLAVQDLHAYYGQSHVLHGVNLAVPRNAIVSLIGRNGTGKTTTFRCIAGLLRPGSGQILFDGRDITALRPHKIARIGLSLVPEDRRIFSSLTVAENIVLAAGGRRDALDEAVAFFPTLQDYLGRPGDRLSGGEQQMLAIARALVSQPQLLLIDEPLEGLAPVINERIQAALENLRGKLTVLIIEQNVRWLLGLADYHYVMHQGQIVYGGGSQEVRNDPELLDRYLGVAA